MTDQTRETTRLPRPVPTRPNPAREFDWDDKPAKVKPRRAAKGVWVPYWMFALLVFLALLPAAILAVTEAVW